MAKSICQVTVACRGTIVANSQYLLHPANASYDGERLGWFVGALVVPAVGLAVGTLEGGKLGWFVGALVGPAVGLAVGTLEGDKLGWFVGALVGLAVGDAEGTRVGPTQSLGGFPHWQTWFVQPCRQPFHEVSCRS